MKQTGKRLAALLLAAAMMIPLGGGVSAADAPSFSDVTESHWAYQYIEDVVSHGYFAGTGETEFSPEQSMTRAMFVTVLSRMAGAEMDDSVATKFDDVPTGTWYTGAVAWAAENGIVNGTGPAAFSPEAEITREQLAVMIVRYCSFAKVELPAAEKKADFTDQDAIGAYAREAVAACAAAGLITGYTDGSFGPLKSAARAEVATIVSRLSDAIGEAPGQTGYVVTFDANGGSEVEAQTVAQGGKVKRPADPTRSGYNFSGWYSDAGLKTRFDFNSEIADDMTLYAKWTKRATGGGGGGGGSYVDPLALRLSDAHPDLVAVDNGDYIITAVSGASVADLKAQVVPEDAGLAYTLQVTDWLDGEKVAGNHRDLLTTGDKLVVSAGGQKLTYRIDVPNKEQDDHYWDTDTYNAILERVGESLPTFGSAVYDITDAKYAGLVRQVEVKGVQVDDYTLAFRQAIADCTQSGGTVRVPARAEPYYTGAIQLDDNVNLHVAEGASIDFLPIATLEYYPRSLVSYEGIDYYGYSSPIYAYQKENVAVTGGGTLGFSDTSCWAEDKEVLQRWNYSNTPVEERDITVTDNKVRPVLVQLYDCRNVLISDVTLGNAPFWTMNLVLCENVLIRGIETTSTSSNSDGCDPESCRYVIIENCRFANKDDNIALKSGRSNNGKLRDRATEYVIIRSNELYQGSGISIGSESAGGVNNVFAENNFYNGRRGDAKPDLRARDAFRIKYANSMDTVFENIYFRNCAMGGFGDSLFYCEYVTNEYMLSVTGQGTDSLPHVPVMRNFAMSNMFSVPNRFGEMDSMFANYLAVAESQDLRPIDGLYFKDIDLVSTNCDPTKKGVLQFNNATNIHMDNVQLNGVELEAEERPITIQDVQINGTALNAAGTTAVTSGGDDGTLVVTGVIATKIEDFETIGSARVSYDSDMQYADAVLSREGDTVRFTATLTGVGADEHDLAVVAKSDKLPFPSPDEDARRAANRAPSVASNRYHIDVEGTLRAMDLSFAFDPALPDTHISPMVEVGKRVVVTVSAVDAQTGAAVSGFTLAAVDATNKGYVTCATEGNRLTITAQAVKDAKNTNNNVDVTAVLAGYAPAEHTIYKVVVMPTSLDLVLAEAHPDLVSVDNEGQVITAVSGASVEDIAAQVVPVDAGLDCDFLVTDWLDEEKAASNNRDLLTTGDKLVVSVGGQKQTYRIDVPNKEVDGHYWDAETYNAILERVGENLPAFKNAVYDITDAKYADKLGKVTISGSEVEDYTQVFRAAIAACTQNGGGTVRVPARAEPYYTGAIQLNDNVELRVEEGATIDFIPIVNPDYYPKSLVSFEGIDYYGYSAPIYAYQKENVAVTGGGTITFSDTSCWAGNKNQLQYWNFGNTPVEERDAVALGQQDPPVLVQLYDCKNVRISEVTLGNAPFWTLNLVLCENVLVRGITTTSISSNSDGCDPESSKYVIIENCRFANKDDNIALKSGRANNGILRGQATEQVIIRGNEFYQGSGISIGSEAAGGVNDVFVENNFFNGIYQSADGQNHLGDIFRIKYANSLDATFENIYYRNCAIGGFRGNLMFIEYCKNEDLFNATGDMDRKNSLDHTAVMRNIAMSNLYTVENRAGELDSLFGQYLILAESQDLRPIDGLYLKDIDLTTSHRTPPSDKLLQINSAVNVHLDNVSVNDVSFSTEEQILEIRDVKVNGTALAAGETTAVTSSGNDGTLVVTGVIDTDIQDFATTGSVRVSFDVDKNYVEGTLSEAEGAITFTATLTGVGADLHDLAVVAKSDQLKCPAAGGEKTNTVPKHAVDAYAIDVEGELRAMDVTFTYVPALTNQHNVPILTVGEPVEITATATDAKSGVPLENVTLTVTKTNEVFQTEVAGNVLTVTGAKTGKNHITVTISKEGFVDLVHTFRHIPVLLAAAD